MSQSLYTRHVAPDANGYSVDIIAGERRLDAIRRCAW